MNKHMSVSSSFIQEFEIKKMELNESTIPNETFCFLVKMTQDLRQQRTKLLLENRKLKEKLMQHGQRKLLIV